MVSDKLNLEFEKQSDFLQMNLHNCNLDLVSKYTPVTSRPDLILKDGKLRDKVSVWTQAEEDNIENWKHDDFNYVLSSLGFRDEEIIETSYNHLDLAVFGCSYTFGVGLPSDNLWHKLLSKSKGLKSYNFGIPGCSIKAACDVFSIVSRHIKIDKAVFLMPTYERQLCASTHNISKNVKLITLLPNNNISINQMNCDIDPNMYYKYIPNAELIRRTKDDIYNIEHLAKLRNIKIFISSWDRPTYKLINVMDLRYMIVLPEWVNPPDHINKKDDARDGLHPGFKHHEYWTKLIENIVCI